MIIKKTLRSVPMCKSKKHREIVKNILVNIREEREHIMKGCEYRLESEPPSLVHAPINPFI